MKLKNWLLGAAAAAAFGAFTTTAQAAPLGTMQIDRATENSAVQDVAWVRRCYWHRGHRHCRRVWRDYGYYDDSYSYGDPYYYGAPYAYGPSFGFFFGGGRGHHHGHHHHFGRGHHHGHHHHHGGRGGRGHGRR